MLPANIVLLDKVERAAAAYLATLARPTAPAARARARQAWQAASATLIATLPDLTGQPC